MDSYFFAAIDFSTRANVAWVCVIKYRAAAYRSSTRNLSFRCVRNANKASDLVPSPANGSGIASAPPAQMDPLTKEALRIFLRCSIARSIFIVLQDFRLFRRPKGQHRWYITLLALILLMTKVRATSKYSFRKTHGDDLFRSMITISCVDDKSQYESLQ